MRFKIILLNCVFILITLFSISCSNNQKQDKDNKGQTHLVVLDPGHFHAALLQKYMNSQIDSVVSVFAPKGKELNDYLDLIKDYNNRSGNPTNWKEDVYKDEDFLAKMTEKKWGENTTVVIAGNNKNKTDYIGKSIKAQLNVLADKPMAINPDDFDSLKNSFKEAEKENLLLYDIMTERYAITNILQKEFVHMTDVFGSIEKGSVKDPAIKFRNLHHFYKKASGKVSQRPEWYFDTEQQGNGLVDVTTHLIDLIQWEAFPKTVLDYENDIKVESAKTWPTKLTQEQFSKVTGADSIPEFLRKDIRNNQLLIDANGELDYTIKGVHINVRAEWGYKAPEGVGDTYYSEIKGTKSNLIIRQDKEQNFEPILYIKPKEMSEEWRASLDKKLDQINQTYPGVELKELGDSLEVKVPKKFEVSPEERFSMVVEKYLDYLKDKELPEWEKSFMLGKYFITARAMEIADRTNK